MQVDEVIVQTQSGVRRKVTRVVQDDFSFVFNRRLPRAEAIRRARAINRSIDKFEEFNYKGPGKLVTRKIDLSVPLVRIGPVPIITYMSSKEGKERSYAHETKKRPVLYMHPSKPIGLLLGGSIKVRDWLYD